MTDRVQGFTVVLDKDIREDQVESLRQAILHLRHVGSVADVITTSETFFARMRVRTEMASKFLQFYQELSKTAGAD